jgi:hypothetical protein
MTQFGSNEEFFDAVKHLIYRWCDERRLRPLALLLPKYVAFNGMTDGWVELHRLLGAYDLLARTARLGYRGYRERSHLRGRSGDPSKQRLTPSPCTSELEAMRWINARLALSRPS